MRSVVVKKISLQTVRKVLVMLLLAVVAGGVGFWWGKQTTSANGESGLGLGAVVNREAQRNVDFSQFWDVWQRLENSYLEPKDIDAKKMVYGAIGGMTSSLGDPYTAYLPPAQNTQSREDLSGEFAGVGIQLGYVDHTLAVMSPLPNQPAVKAGIMAGDLILHIKDEKKGIDVDTDGMSLTEAVQNIRGRAGEVVILTIFTEGDGKSREVPLVRETIVVPSVDYKVVDAQGKPNEQGRYAYLQVIKFGDKTMTEWAKGVDQILGNKNIDGIVLDLRNNPGGFLQRAVDLASEFIPSGVVVAQQGRYETETFSVNRQGRLIGRKLVIVVNRGSASAAEILAGALREQVGAKLVGEKTFGKGTVQEAQELPGGAGLHVTIARWLLPKGTNIHKVGLEPDILVEPVEAAEGETPVDTQLIRAIQELGK